MTLRHAVLLPAFGAALAFGCVHIQQDRLPRAGCCGNPCGAGAGSDRLRDALRADFQATWRAYKKALLGGDVGSSLVFHPEGHAVRVARDGIVRMVSRREAQEEALRRRYLEIEEVEGPNVITDPCGCGLWVVGTIRVKSAPVGGGGSVEEEQSFLGKYDDERNDWRFIATQNGIANPRRLEPGDLKP